eukprot:m.317762 g.317762  ORF g.317762 m.317762 type:complete len:83 (-) comp15986_c0_seq21:1263-1511(-)
MLQNNAHTKHITSHHITICSITSYITHPMPQTTIANTKNKLSRSLITYTVTTSHLNNSSILITTLKYNHTHSRSSIQLQHHP